MVFICAPFSLLSGKGSVCLCLSCPAAPDDSVVTSELSICVWSEGMLDSCAPHDIYWFIAINICVELLQTGLIYFSLCQTLLTIGLLIYLHWKLMKSGLTGIPFYSHVGRYAISDGRSKHRSLVYIYHANPLFQICDSVVNSYMQIHLVRPVQSTAF